MNNIDKSVKTTIHGDATGVNITGADSTVHATTSISSQDTANFELLVEKLSKFGVDRSDAEQLRSVLEDEKSYGKEMGPKTKSWIQRTIPKVLHFTVDTAAIVLAECIAHYCGWMGESSGVIPK